MSQTETSVTSSFVNKTNAKIFTRRWNHTTESLSGVIYLMHGLGEHSGRYERLASYFASQGFTVLALDHQGHGNSEGDRCYVERFTHYIDDVEQLYESTASEFGPDAKKFIFGHSMGGLIAILTILRLGSDKFSGAILSAPAIQPGADVSQISIWACKALSVLFPKLGIQALESGSLTTLPEEVKLLDEDPLNYRGKVTARLGAELLWGLDQVPLNKDAFTFPYLLLHPEQDKVVAISGSEWFHANVASQDKTYITYKGYHEIHNDVDREKERADIVEWINKHL